MAITYSVTQLVDPREPEVAGKFYAKAQARSKGAVSREEFTADLIKAVHLQFRPGKGLNSLLQVDALKFKKVPGLNANVVEEDPDSGLGA